jgi:hypothetical protein
MSYIVKAASPSGPIEEPFETAKEAIECGLELAGQGLTEISITTPDGKRFGPDEFHQLYIKYRKLDSDWT